MITLFQSEFTVFVSITIAIFAMITIATMGYVRRILRYNEGYRAYIRLAKINIQREKTNTRINMEQCKFLFDMLMDLCSCENDATILYKAVNMRAILMLMDYNPERDAYIGNILREPQYKYINSILSDMMNRYQGRAALEPETGTAYDRFMMNIDKLSKESMTERDQYNTAVSEVYTSAPEIFKSVDSSSGVQVTTSGRV